MGKACVRGVIFGQTRSSSRYHHHPLRRPLLIGVPGLGKSRLVETMGVVLGLKPSACSSPRI
jgi:hypothetical protein